MFSGIVESVQSILSVEPAEKALRIRVSRPPEFNDLKIGDSISTNGVCLTIEAFTSSDMTFTLGAETIQVLGLETAKSEELLNTKLNLERSLRFGDRIHGHLVTGHVDSRGLIVKRNLVGESLLLEIRINPELKPLLWKKGSITLNGVSLTLNEVFRDIVSVCLIPETLRRTNLNFLKEGDLVNVEPDYMARAILNYQLNKHFEITDLGVNHD